MAPVELQQIFEAMDALSIGEITLGQYRKVPQQTRLAAKQWRVQQATRWFTKRHPDLSCESGIST